MDHDEVLEIKVATHSDIADIIAICEQNLVENNREKFSENDFSKKGFLVQKPTITDLEKMIDDKKNYLVLILKNNDEALGYLTGADISKENEDVQKAVLQSEELKNSHDKIFFHKQIAKKSGVKKVGEKLLLAMFDEARNRGYLHVACRIIHQPFYNQASISFHEKFGFKKIAMMVKKENTAGVYLKNL